MDFATVTGMLLSPVPMALMLLGTFLGICVGAIPGLTGTMLIALSLPLTFSMSAPHALVMLIAMYVGSISGGLISATILRMPGTPAAVMTTMDGYPMAQSGHAVRALGLGISASFFGGMVSWVALVSLSRPLSDWAARFGPFELFSLVLMALILITSVSGKSVLRGLIAGFFGMLVAMPGVDPSSGQLRLTFGIHQLDAGFSLMPVLIGVFGVGQIISDVMGIDRKTTAIEVKSGRVLLSFAEWRSNLVNLIRSSVIGTWVGILPGIGANIGSVLAYTAARKSSKNPQKFGSGSEEGIIASESANNATVGGALIPLIAMGIPGSIVDAILLGAMTIHGIVPGPLLFQNNPNLVGTMMGSALIANIMMFFIMLLSVRYIARLNAIPKSYLLPVIILFCVIGSFALHNRWFDVWVMLGFGLVGYAFERFRFPLGPFIIGLVLAPIAEKNLRTGLMISGDSYLPFITRPISALFLSICIAMLLWQIWSGVSSRSGPGASPSKG